MEAEEDMKVIFPKIAIPAWKVERGAICTDFLGIFPLVIPTDDITFWDEIVLVEEFTIFDSDEMAKSLTNVIGAVPNAVWALATSTMDNMATDYYKEHPAIVITPEEYASKVVEMYTSLKSLGYFDTELDPYSFVTTSQDLARRAEELTYSERWDDLKAKQSNYDRLRGLK